jgi:hypothetical protein
VPDYTRRPSWAATTERVKLLPGDSAAGQLAELMGTLSERCYCAEWLTGLEGVLWGFTAEVRDYRWGLAGIEADEIEHLRRLAVTAGGWVEWSDGDGESLDGVEGEGPRLVRWV